jgi:hypothetical protein
MFIHIGEKKNISTAKLIGIFNRDTLILSEDNKWLVDKISENDKTVAVEEKNRITSSIVSPFTIIKRDSLNNEFIWSREDV